MSISAAPSFGDGVRGEPADGKRRRSLPLCFLPAAGPPQLGPSEGARSGGGGGRSDSP